MKKKMLSDQQIAQFEEEGYLLLSGLIPQETVKSRGSDVANDGHGCE